MEKILPKGWVETTLGEIAEWGSGGTPNRAIADYYNGTIPWVKTGDLNDGLITHSNEFITELGLQKSSAKIFPKGSVVLAMYGATIGKTGILDFDSSTNQACAVAKTFFKMNKFLFFFLKSEKETFIEKGKGGAQPNISQTVIKTHKIALPPLAEQERIVAKLDALFTQHEIMQKALERIPQLLKNFRQQVLTQAVTGKLTEQWRGRKALEEWKVDIIKNIATKLGSGSTPRGGSEAYIEEGIPLVRSMNVIFGGIKLDGLAFINETQANALKNVEIHFEDILLNITGASIGRLCLADENVTGGRVNQHVFIIRPKKNIVLPQFIESYLRSNLVQSFIEEIKYGAGMEAISKTQIENLEINIPPLQEQEEINSRVESLFAKAYAIEERYTRLKKSIASLPQALLHKAFKGELVPQLPTDRDAKDLLTEIMKLKNEVKGKKK
jgi:type I restriction enzyme S subunit